MNIDAPLPEMSKYMSDLLLFTPNQQEQNERRKRKKKTIPNSFHFKLDKSKNGSEQNLPKQCNLKDRNTPSNMKHQLRMEERTISVAPQHLISQDNYVDKCLQRTLPVQAHVAHSSAPNQQHAYFYTAPHHNISMCDSKHSNQEMLPPIDTLISFIRNQEQ